MFVKELESCLILAYRNKLLRSLYIINTAISIRTTNI